MSLFIFFCFIFQLKSHMCREEPEVTLYLFLFPGDV